MKETFRLGRIAGVDVGAHWSVAIVFLLVAVGLGGGHLPDRYPESPATAYAVAGALGALAFTASLLAHEVAHAVVARRNGIEIHGITLWLLGGVARLRGEPDDAAAELRVAAVGPATSIALALAFLGLRWGLWWTGGRGVAVGTLDWLALVNAVLAGFNLVPAAPLDGGRILRALLWRRRGDRVAASVVAAHAGRTFGWLLVGVGILDLLLGTGGGGLWLVMVGWFIANAAAAEESQAEISEAVGGLAVMDLMTPDPAVVPADISVRTFLDRYVARTPHPAYPIVDRGRHPVGLVTLSRVRRVPESARDSTTVAAIAAGLHDVAVAAPFEPVIELLPRMAAAPDHRAIVVSGGQVVGIVSPADVGHRLEVSALETSRGA